MTKQLLNTKEAASLMRMSPGTLEIWRSDGRGPRYRKIGWKVFYTVEDLQEFIESGLVRTRDSW